MKKVSLLFFFILFTTVIYSQKATDAEKLEQFYQDSQFDKIINYKKGKIKSLDAQSLFFKGLAYFNKENDKKALEFFELSIEKDPINEHVHFYKGLTLFYLENFAKSIESFDKAIAINPNSPDFYALKGEAYNALKKTDLAVAFFTKAISFEDCRPVTYVSLAELYQQQKNYDSALVIYKKALEIIEPSEKSYQNCSYNIGLLYQMTEKYEKAKQAFKEHIHLFPDDYHAVSKIIQSLYALGEGHESDVYKKMLFKAEKAKKLPEGMETMYCFEQFKWNNRDVLAFELFDEYEDDLIVCKYKYIILDKEGEMDYKIQTELDTTAGAKEYVLKMIRNDSLFTFKNYTFYNDVDFNKLKEAVLAILNNDVEPVNIMSPYGEWIAKLRAEKSNLSKLERDGSSFEKAVIVNSVPEEYKWLKKYYPGSTFIQQSLVFEKDKPYDVLKIKTADKQEIDVYFDISKFFGKGF